MPHGKPRFGKKHGKSRKAEEQAWGGQKPIITGPLGTARNAPVIVHKPKKAA